MSGLMKRESNNNLFSHRSHSDREFVVVLKSDLQSTHHHHTLCYPQMESRLTTVLLMAIVAVSTLLAVCIPETEARPSRHAIMDNPAWQQIVGMIQEDINDQVNECEASVRNIFH